MQHAEKILLGTYVKKRPPSKSRHTQTDTLEINFNKIWTIQTHFMHLSAGPTDPW